MAARADAPAAVGGGPAEPLHPGRHALEVAERRVGLGDEQDGAERDQRHRDQVLRRIERQLGVERRVVGVRRVGGDQEGVAVGRRLGDDLRADDGVGAGLGIDHHLLAEPRRQRIGDHPHHGVDRAARIERHDDAHRLGRPGRLGPRDERREQAGGEECAAAHGQDFTQARLRGRSALTRLPTRCGSGWVQPGQRFVPFLPSCPHPLPP